MLKLTNNASAKLASAMSGSTQTLTVDSGSGALFPALSTGDWFPVTVVRKIDPTKLEVMRCTARSGDTLTVTRAQEGTSAITFDVGDVVELRLTALALRGLDAASVGGHVVGTGDDDIPLKGSLPTPPTVVQSTGTSQEDVMSQYAVTAMFDKAALTNLTAADAGKIVMVNAAGDGFVLGPKISTDDVANTVAVRDANGSITANDIISTGESS